MSPKKWYPTKSNFFCLYSPPLLNPKNPLLKAFLRILAIFRRKYYFIPKYSLSLFLSLSLSLSLSLYIYIERRAVGITHLIPERCNFKYLGGLRERERERVFRYKLEP